MAHWVSDNELIGELGEYFVDELDFSGLDMSVSGRLAMVEQANLWLADNGKPLRVEDVADVGGELMWLTNYNNG